MILAGVDHQWYHLHPIGFRTTDWVAGTLGVVLGLFICSRAAAHLLDLLYQSHYAGPPKLWIWLTLNLLTLLAGVIVVFIGVMQFTRSTIGR